MLFSSKTSFTGVLPSTLSERVDVMLPDSTISSTITPFLVLQSSSLITASWATSTSLLVKYPLLAVFNAVSASPFLAPCVDVKYSSTDKPSWN